MVEEIRNNVAYVIHRLNEVRGEKPGKKMLQKTVFLIEEKGVNLGYDFGMHFYGPYSEALSATTLYLNADGVLEFEFKNHAHLLSVNEHEYKILPEQLSEDQLAALEQVINRFKDLDAAELELLTTTIYVFNHLESKTATHIIGGVEKIKGSKYSRARITKSLEHLPFFNKEVPVCR